MDAPAVKRRRFNWITSDYIRNIPLNGRNPYGLGLLAGHTTPTTGTSSDGLAFVAGGGRYTSNEVLLDGVDNRIAQSRSEARLNCVCARARVSRRSFTRRIA